MAWWIPCPSCAPQARLCEKKNKTGRAHPGCNDRWCRCWDGWNVEVDTYVLLCYSSTSKQSKQWPILTFPTATNFLASQDANIRCTNTPRAPSPLPLSPPPLDGSRSCRWKAFLCSHLGLHLGGTPDIFLRHELLRDHGVKLLVALAYCLLQLNLAADGAGENGAGEGISETTGFG